CPGEPAGKKGYKYTHHVIPPNLGQAYSRGRRTRVALPYYARPRVSVTAPPVGVKGVLGSPPRDGPTSPDPTCGFVIRAPNPRGVGFSARPPPRSGPERPPPGARHRRPRSVTAGPYPLRTLP